MKMKFGHTPVKMRAGLPGASPGEFKNHRRSRSRRGNEAEVFFGPKSASVRRRLPFLNSPWEGLAVARKRSRDRQLHEESGPFPLLGLAENPAPVGLNDRLGDGQSQAASAVPVRRDERLEKPLFAGVRTSAPLLAHADCHPPI